MDPESNWITAELRRVAEAERAPHHLRERVVALGDARTVGRPRRAVLRLGALRTGGLLATAAVLAVALVLVLGSTAGSGPSVRQLAAVGLRGGWSSDGEPHPVGHGRLDVSIGRLRFPDWYGWQAVGARSERLDGRTVETVYYQRGDRTVVYSVAAGPRLRGQRPGFVSLRLDGRSVLTWTRDGMSCVASTRTASPSDLLDLAYLA